MKMRDVLVRKCFCGYKCGDTPAEKNARFLIPQFSEFCSNSLPAVQNANLFYNAVNETKIVLVILICVRVHI